jgi:hypothetical protein
MDENNDDDINLNLAITTCEVCRASHSKLSATAAAAAVYSNEQYVKQ